MTNLKSAVFGAGAALLLPFAPVQAQETDDMTADTVVATVNGTDITLGHLIMARTLLPEQYQQLPEDVLFDGLLDQLIQQQLLAETLDTVPQRVVIALENEERSRLAGEQVAEIYDTAVTDDELEAAYADLVDQMGDATEWNAAHILVDTEEEAIDIKAQIDEGGDFEELAREFSTGPSGPNGGALGWFGLGMMVEPFEAAVVLLEEGQVSEPVQTQFGWHIVKLNETRTQEAPSLDDLRSELTAQIQQQALEARLAELTEAATITRPETGAVDPALLGQPDLLED